MTKMPVRKRVPFMLNWDEYKELQGFFRSRGFPRGIIGTFVQNFLYSLLFICREVEQNPHTELTLSDTYELLSKLTDNSKLSQLASSLPTSRPATNSQGPKKVTPECRPEPGKRTPAQGGPSRAGRGNDDI